MRIMFLKITCIGLMICAFNQITYSLPIPQYYQDNSGVESSPLGDLFRYKAQFVDKVSNSLHEAFQRGFSVLSNNLNNLGTSVNSLIGATGQLMNNGLATGKQYGTTIIEGAMIVPKTIADLVLTSRQNDKNINNNPIENLSYINNKPNYVFQFVDKQGRIIPVTREIALQLVPNLSI